MKNESWSLLGHNIGRGEKLHFMVHPYDDNYDIPVTIINGVNKGKTIVVSAGVHSGEYPGVAACSILSKQIDPLKVNGRIIILHCINTQGFFAKHERFVPEDGGNMNGVFPGDREGTISKRIAAFLEDNIMNEADFVVDLHSGGGEEPLLPCLFFPVAASEEVNKASLEVAKATTINHLIASTAKNGFYSYATTKGIPAILLERGNLNKCEREDYEAYVEDIYLILDYFKVMDKKDKKPLGVKFIWRKTDYMTCEQTGLWYSDVEAGMILKKGDLIGYVKDFFGNVLGEYRAVDDCRVMYNHVGLMIKEGGAIGAFGLLKNVEIVD
ncbi:MAG: M14 family metallopeptidase [Intestinibacter sp.]|uniref:M14 family metallopeptidase n=1 Tax=Intestinibacter sp. TaxID=1965304 RepID=UPI002A820D64|nr:M14 family metallopeptidase [Intestinibacter sp.]MDY4574117.1 M14 family metallopeptidase [Intestinibacter sp.]